PPRSTLFPYTTLFRSLQVKAIEQNHVAAQTIVTIRCFTIDIRIGCLVNIAAFGKVHTCTTENTGQKIQPGLVPVNPALLHYKVALLNVKIAGDRGLYTLPQAICHHCGTVLCDCTLSQERTKHKNTHSSYFIHDWFFINSINCSGSFHPAG